MRNRTALLVGLLLPILPACTAEPSDGASNPPSPAPMNGASNSESSSGTAASTAAPAATSNESVPAPSCTRTMCDVDRDRCEASYKDSCERCHEACKNVSYDVVVACLQTCTDICSAGSSASSCGSEAQSCRSTPRNEVCVDGIDPANLPTEQKWTASYHPPTTPHQDVCTAADVATYVSCSLQTGFSTPACEAFVASHVACVTCIQTPVASSEWGAIVYAKSETANDTWINVPGCVAAVAGDASCAKKIYAANACASRCWNAKDVSVCGAFVAENDCKTQFADAEACVAANGYNDAPQFDACADLASIATYFCGQ